MNAALETRQLTRRFGQRTVVDAISMTVPNQAVYGFLGRNGAGKTTTLKMLLGLIRPTEGTAYVHGTDVTRHRIGAAGKIGALLEAHGFYAHLTGRENLDLTRRLLGAPRSEADRVLEIVGMRADAARRVGGYSLGMRQRLSLARAMLGAPPILILDEPTNGLDPDGITEMREFLRDLPARTGATVLLSSHLLGEIEQIASHVGVIHQGRLVLEGELAVLKAAEAPEIILRVDDRLKAAAALQRYALVPEEGDEGLVVRLEPGRGDAHVAAALNRALVEAGVGVEMIRTRHPSLEGLYRRFTASPRTLNEAA